ncbi:MAG: enoyl-CoA hydratase/isomerase family protein [Gammaproteobacteria bacterium]|nr:enoyl-CoA hydratase/isomerase family protein [Gammaproteobacteria bacterium]
MSDEPLIIKDDSGVRHLILNRPDKINAIDYAQHLRLMSQFDLAEEDPSVKVVALSGVGRGFCSGDDLTAAAFEGQDPYRHRKVDLEMGSGPAVLLESCRKLHHLSKPTVALMHGIALGSGYDYSLSCDFRVVTLNIRYGDPRIDRALWAAEGWSYKLPRLTNLSIVSRVAYLGEIMNGSQAIAFGLAHAIVDGEPDIRESSRTFLENLVRVSSPAYSQVKHAMLRGLDSDVERALALA